MWYTISGTREEQSTYMNILEFTGWHCRFRGTFKNILLIFIAYDSLNSRPTYYILFPTVHSLNILLVFPWNAMYELPSRDRTRKMKHGIIVDQIGEGSNPIVRIELSATKESSSRKMVVWRKVRTKEGGLLALCCKWVAEHQIGKLRRWCSLYKDSLDFPGIALNLLTLLRLAHVYFPRFRKHTRKC